MLNGLDLFAGIGGIALALEPWVKPVAYCEIDPYAQSVLIERMQTGELANAPIWDDVRTLRASMLPPIDIISGGFPCQDISQANPDGRGLDGQRSGLFFEIMRLVDELRPSFVFLENVPEIINRGGLRVTAELAARGYDTRWDIISAKDVGAKHLRRRFWLLAHSTRVGSKGGDNVTGNISQNDQAERREVPDRHYDPKPQGNWQARANQVYRDAYGVSAGVDRLRCIGNAVVPQQAREAFKRLMGIK